MKIVSDYMAYLKNNPERYWFKRKLYGWGWTPATWEGWVSILVFLGLLVFNAFRLEVLAGVEEAVAFTFAWQTLLLTGVLILICYKTGESPRWQWGVPKSEKSEEHN